MRTPRRLVIVPLFFVVWLLATLTSGGPGAVAHAIGAPRTWDASHAVAQDDEDNNSDDHDQNENDNEEHSNNNNNDNSSNNNNDNRSDITVVPVTVPAPAPAPPPPGASASPVDEVSQCLSNGGELVYHGPDAGIGVTSFQDNLNVTLTRVSPTAQPAPPGSIVGNYVFRLSASPCGGAPYSVLPREVNLALSYSDALAAGRDESRFSLMYYDGTAWATAPKLYRDPDHNTVSASVTGLGVYALVQQ